MNSISINRGIFSPLLVGTLVATAPLASEAAPIAVRIGDAISAAVTCNDGAVCDVNPSLDGVVTFSYSMDNWIVSVTTGVGYGDQGQGSISDPYLHLSNLNLSYDNGSSPTNPLTVMVSETNFNTVVVSDLFNFKGAGTLDATSVRIDAYLDTSNTLFGMGPGTFLGSLGPYSTTSSLVFAGETNLSGSSPSPFSLTLVATFTPTATSGFHTSFMGADIRAVPVPAAAWLLGSGLVGLIGLGRRKLS
jgi:hypothetical protein